MVGHVDKYAGRTRRPTQPRDCWTRGGRPKRSYTREAARRAVADLVAAGEDVHCYRCPICSAWHIGHLPHITIERKAG